jgi:hypothetical protein
VPVSVCTDGEPAVIWLRELCRTPDRLREGANVAGDVDQLDPRQVRYALVLRPGRELGDGGEAGFTRIPVTDDGFKT